MNKVGAAASSAKAYMYVYNALLYMCCIVFYMCRLLSGPQNQHLVYKIAQYIMQIFIYLKMIWFQPRRFIRGNTWIRYVVARCIAG